MIAPFGAVGPAMVASCSYDCSPTLASTSHDGRGAYAIAAAKPCCTRMTLIRHGSSAAKMGVAKTRTERIAARFMSEAPSQSRGGAGQRVVLRTVAAQEPRELHTQRRARREPQARTEPRL